MHVQNYPQKTNYNALNHQYDALHKSNKKPPNNHKFNFLDAETLSFKCSSIAVKLESRESRITIGFISIW